MKILIDSSELDDIRHCIEYFPIDGVNVSDKLDLAALNRIRALIGEDCELHVPVDSFRAEEIVDEAHMLTDDLGANTYIKIPVGSEGFKAMKMLELSKVAFAAVNVQNTMQALVAGNCGASYVSTFVNRLSVQSAVDIVKNIQDALKRNVLETQVVAAHFKNSRQASELCEYGIGSVAVSSDMLSSMVADGDHV